MPGAAVRESATLAGRAQRARVARAFVTAVLGPGHPGADVAVLLKIYAHCIDGQATAANQRIAEALGIQDAEDDPGDEGGGDTEQAS
jgi:hypothetical protein